MPLRRTHGEEPRPLFAFAGVWHRHVGPIKKDGPSVELDVYSFMTTTPNALVGTINHERMPVLLSTDEQFATWMTGTPDEAFALLREYPPDTCGWCRPGSRKGICSSLLCDIAPSARLKMRHLKLSKAFTLIEPGPVVLVTTTDGGRDNVMTISWTMVLDFTPMFAITTGEWNFSFAALRKSRECVIAVPAVDLLDRVVGIGTCSGTDTDKFAKFRLTAVPAKVVKAPLIKECLANIECKVIDIVARHNVVVLEGVAAHIDSARKEKRMVHAVGDGTFIVDGRRIDRRKMMASKIPAGV